MKSLFSLSVLALGLLALPAFADSLVTPAQNQKVPVLGICEIIESLENPFPGPCVRLLLNLTDEQGKTIDQERTTARGRFEFTAERGKGYRITCVSHFYKVAEPTDEIRGGDRVRLKLQLK